MAIRVGDLVQPNIHGGFHSDVQLSTYEDDPERNLQLAKSYIFTSSPRGQELGSVELLETLCEAFLATNVPNRFGVVATYGHGKSHFAVAVANFFGKANGTPETSAVFDGLRHALGDDPLLRRFEAFKKMHRPFLVILLRGDEPGDLTSKFYRALERALADHEETKTVRPPFWFNAAERFLKRVQDEKREQADAWLRRHNMDLAMLLHRLAERDDSVYDLCSDLSYHLYELLPNFEGATSLRDMVEWATDELCGAGKPFSGALILFDEFSTFIRNYMSGHQGRAGAPLQDLLNGVEDRRGSAAFVALAQLDPKAAARSAGASQEQIDSVSRELNRIEKIFTLRSVLEEVLASYLKQDDAIWRHVFTDPALQQQMKSATDLAWKTFRDRYEQDLKWAPETFRTVVTKGSYPLHPATTALLSSIRFQAVESPRTVLQFAFDVLNLSQDLPLVEDSKLFWVPAVRLVQYFDTMFDPGVKTDFDAAVRQLGPDVPDTHSAILDAMLLVALGKVSSKAVGFPRIIAEFAVIDVPTATEALEDLERRGVIRRDPVGGAYTFWPAGRGAYQVEAKLGQKISQVTLGPGDVELVMGHLGKRGGFEPILVDVPWGNSQDWQADQIILLRDQVTVENLRQELTGLIEQPDRVTEARGRMIWLLAASDADVAWYRDEVVGLLDAAVGSLGRPTPPVVIMRPRSANGDIFTLMRRVRALATFTDREIGDVGHEAYNQVLKRDKEELGKLLTGLQSESDLIVPLGYRDIPFVTQMALRVYLRELFLRAFRLGPREFFTQYKASTTNLRRAVSAVARGLADDNLALTYQSLDSVARDLVDKFLREDGKWRLLSSTSAVRPPTSDSALSHGWQLLEKGIPEGSEAVRLYDSLVALLNAPYGYDSQTALLLVAAWYGYHRHELGLSVDGQTKSLATLVVSTKTPSEALASLGRSSLTRESLSKIEQQVQEIVAKESGGGTFSQQEAELAIDRLDQCLNTSRGEPARQFQITKVKTQLTADLERAREYDKAADKLAQLAEREWDLAKVLGGLKDLAALPQTGRVSTIGPSRHELQQQLRQRIEAAVEQSCATLERPRSVDAAATNQQQLEQLKRRLQAQGLAPLVARVEQASARLSEGVRALEREEANKREDEKLLPQVRLMAVSPNPGLAICRAYLRKLEEAQPHTSPAVQAVAAKRNELTKVIEELESFIAGVRQRASQATDPGLLDRIFNEALSRKALYAETEEGSQLDKLLERLQAVSDVLVRSDALRRVTLDSPGDLGVAQERLNQLLADAAGHLSVTQIGAIESIAAELVQRAQGKVKDAIVWLDQVETENVRGADPESLLDQLKRPPAFLPPDEQQRLERLRAQVEERLSEDAARQVERFFVQIRDRDKQRALLAKLEQLLRGVTAP